MTERPAPPSERATADPPVAGSAVAAWAALEFALAIWGTAVATIQVPLWLAEDLGQGDTTLGVTRGAATVLLVLLGPVAGAASDRAGRTPFLAAAVVVCAAATALLGVTGLVVSLAAFVLASVGQGVGLIVIDALLPAVSPPERLGRIGGLGVVAGLAGSFAGIGLSLLVADLLGGGRRGVFLAVALLVVLLGLPALRRLAGVGLAPAGTDPAPRMGWGLGGAVAQVRAVPGLGRLLVAHFFYSDAGATLTAFMAVYAVREVGFTETAAQLVILAGIGAGIAGGAVGGVVTDRYGPKPALTLMLGCWLAVFAGAAAIPLLGLAGGLFWLVAPFAGFSVGGVWAAERPFLIGLAPAAVLGQLFGLFNSVGRVAAGAGPLLWALIADGLGWGRPAAVLSLGLLTVLALVALAGVPAPKLRAAVEPERDVPEAVSGVS